MQHSGNRLGCFIALLIFSGCGGAVSDPPPDTNAASHLPTNHPTPTPSLGHELSQQEAWSKCSEAARDSPDVNVRLQALETWAQRPDDNLDPITYGLVDQDETVRERAQELYTHHLQLEATGAASGENTSIQRRSHRSATDNH